MAIVCMDQRLIPTQTAMATERNDDDLAVEAIPELTDASRVPLQNGSNQIQDKTGKVVTGSSVFKDQREASVFDRSEAVNDGEEKDEDEPQPTATFPQRLMNILANEDHVDIISWLPHGKGFIIHNKKRFESEVMPTYFKKSKFTSFTRKLNRWNFQRVSRGSEAGAYYHEHFQRGNIRLCMQMVCKSERPKISFVDNALAAHFTQWSPELGPHQILAQQHLLQQHAALLAASNFASQVNQFDGQNAAVARIQQLDQQLQRQQQLSALAGIAAGGDPLIAAQLAAFGAPGSSLLGGSPLNPPLAAVPVSLPSFLPTAVGTGIQGLQRNSTSGVTAADNYIAMLMAQEKMNPTCEAASSAMSKSHASGDDKAVQDALRETAQRTQMNLLQQAAQHQQSLDQQGQALPGASGSVAVPGSPARLESKGDTGTRGNVRRASAA